MHPAACDATTKTMFLAEIDRLLITHYRPWRRRMAALVIFACLQASAVVLRPLPIKALVEPPPSEGWTFDAAQWLSLPWLWFCIVAVLAIELTILVMRFNVEWGLSTLCERVTRSIRRAIAMRLLRGPYRDVAAISMGNMLASASSDLEAVERLLREAMLMGTVAALQLLLILAVIFWTDQTLFLILIAQIIAMGFGIAAYARFRKKKYLEKMGVVGRLLGLITSLHMRLLDVRFSGLRAVFASRIGGALRQLYDANLKLWRRHGAYHTLIDFTTGVSSALCLVVLIVTAEGETLPVGKFLMFLYYTVLIFPNLSQIGESWPMITDARAALTRLGPSSGLGEAPMRVPSEIEPPRFGQIVFDKVTLLGERGEPLLENVSFTVAPGEQFCLAGDSGTGKSTILSLLLGLTRPTSGRVTINGIDASELSLYARKRFFVFARATSAFVPGPLIENIALHRALDDEALQRILQQARLERRLSVHAVTHDATIGEKGEPFSAGEQQRIAATRLFHADQPCVVLDEALNSLDEAGEIGVMQALMHDLPGKTLIVISHRRVVTTMFQRRLELLGGGRSQLIEPPAGVAAT